MTYFVTGGTGFIGRNLIELLMKREGTIYVLVREGSRGRLEELLNRWGAEEGRIELRIGIHIGDIIIEEGDIFGRIHGDNRLRIDVGRLDGLTILEEFRLTYDAE